MFTPEEKDQIREWLAFAALYRFADPQLEGAIEAIENGKPETEVRIRGYLVKLAALDVQLDETLDCSGNAAVGDITIDPIRQILMIERRQRVYCGRLADALSMQPYRDATTGAESMPGGHFLGQLRQGWPS